MDARNKHTVTFDLPEQSLATPGTTVDDDYDPLSGSMFIQVNPTPLPVKHRPSSTYNTYQRLNGSHFASFHNISLAAKSDSNNSARFFYKENQPNSEYMPELESYSWGCYYLLIPRYVPESTRAIYNVENRDEIYRGVSSKSIPGFKSTKDIPLQESDLKFTLLNEGVKIEDMENIDQAALSDPDFNARDNQDILTELQIDNNCTIKVTVEDLKRYRIARGLGCSLTASYIFEEDDLHRGNISKEGQRIDFDMSIWTILTKFKSCGYFNDYFRNRNVESRFKIHEDDIRNFPNLSHASPYYWPTKPINTSNQIVSIVSTNPWGTEENAIYQKLSTNPVFNYFKYQTLLKFILTSADNYRAIAEMHIRSKLHDSNRSIIDILSEHLHSRIQLIKNTLVNMPEFVDFLKVNGNSAFNRICAEIRAANTRYQTKIQKTDMMLLSLETDNHDFIMACAKKLNISYQYLNDRTVKEQILITLAARKEAYLKQIISERTLTNSFAALKTTIGQIEEQEMLIQAQKKLIEDLQEKMRTEAETQPLSIFSAAPSLK